MDILSGIELAIKNEADGIEFYRKAKDKTKHPIGKMMFEAFMQDEKEHLDPGQLALEADPAGSRVSRSGGAGRGRGSDFDLSAAGFCR